METEMAIILNHMCASAVATPLDTAAVLIRKEIHVPR